MLHRHPVEDRVWEISCTSWQCKPKTNQLCYRMDSAETEEHNTPQSHMHSFKTKCRRSQQHRARGKCHVWHACLTCVKTWHVNDTHAQQDQDPCWSERIKLFKRVCQLLLVVKNIHFCTALHFEILICTSRHMCMPASHEVCAGFAFLLNITEI